MPTGDPPLTLADLRDIPLERLKGVGPALETRLADMELHNVLDLLQHYPRRWIDRTKKTDIAALAVGEEATVFAEVRTIHGRRTRTGPRARRGRRARRHVDADDHVLQPGRGARSS